jgi:outer membrane assembly lipoprotein YfiO
MSVLRHARKIVATTLARCANSKHGWLNAALAYWPERAVSRPQIRLRAFACAWLAVFGVSVLTLTGCSLFGKKSPANDPNDYGYDTLEDRSRPWVKEYDSSSLDPAKDEKYLLDSGSGDKIKDSVNRAIGKGPDRQIATDLLDQADDAYMRASNLRAEDPTSAEAQALFANAGELYEDAAERWPRSSLEQDALFRAGESYFFCDKYAKSNRCYEKLVSRYRGTRYMDIAQSRRFAIAKYWLDYDRAHPDTFASINFFDSQRPWRDTGGHALRVFDRIRIDDPTGKLADDATLALANGYFEARRFMDASDTYEDLRRTYPQSDHIFRAHMYELRARLESYQGEDYDNGNLVKAEKLLKTMLNQFPGEIDEHREYLQKEAANVRHLLASRQDSMANYYERRGEYQAARMYYETLIQDYPETQLAQEARTKVGEIKDLPAEPPERMAWLTDLFPEPKETQPLMPASVKDTLMR